MPSQVRVEVDLRQLDLLAQQFERGGEYSIVRLLEQGEEFIREEAPERTGNLKGKRNAGGSVSSTYRKTGTGFSGDINVSAVQERLNAASGEAVSAKGVRRNVKLRAQKAFNYAEVVATGRPRLTAPKKAQAFLIAVQSPPSSGGYIVARGQIYVVRKSVGPQKANDYPGRALNHLAADAEAIVLKAFTDAGVLG